MTNEVVAIIEDFVTLVSEASPQNIIRAYAIPKEAKSYAAIVYNSVPLATNGLQGRFYHSSTAGDVQSFITTYLAYTSGGANSAFGDVGACNMLHWSLIANALTQTYCVMRIVFFGV